MLSIATVVATIFVDVKSRFDLKHLNDSKCSYLLERVIAIEPSIQRFLSSDYESSNEEHETAALHQLKSCLNNVDTFISSYSSKSWAYKIVWCSKIDTTFKELDTTLTTIAGQLCLETAVLSLSIDRAILADVQEMKKIVMDLAAADHVGSDPQLAQIMCRSLSSGGGPYAALAEEVSQLEVNSKKRHAVLLAQMKQQQEMLVKLTGMVEAMQSGQYEKTHSKLVILGDTAVGKSSLRERLAKNTFQTYNEPTIACAFASIDRTRYKLELWDTAGQERYRSLAPMYYKGANVIILMYDVTVFDSLESINGVRSWLTEIRQSDSLPEHTFVILIGSKIDLVDLRTVSFQQGRALADEYGAFYCEVSSKTSEGYEGLLDIIAAGGIKPVEEETPSKRSFEIEESTEQRQSAWDPRRIVFYPSTVSPHRGGSISGFLVKRGKVFKNWKTRWMVLTQGSPIVRYYVSQSDLKPRGAIRVTRNSEIALADEFWDDAYTCVRLITPTRVWYVGLPKRDANKWIAHFKSIIAAAGAI